MPRSSLARCFLSALLGDIDHTLPKTPFESPQVYYGVDHSQLASFKHKSSIRLRIPRILICLRFALMCRSVYPALRFPPGSQQISAVSSFDTKTGRQLHRSPDVVLLNLLFGVASLFEHFIMADLLFRKTACYGTPVRLLLCTLSSIWKFISHYD